MNNRLPPSRFRPRCPATAPPHLLVGDAESFTAGGQDSHRRRLRQDQPRSDRRQRPERARSYRTPTIGPALQCGGHALGHRLAGLLGSENRSHRIGHRRSISDTRQFEHPHTVGKLSANRAATPNAKRVFTHPRRRPSRSAPVLVPPAAVMSPSSASRPMSLPAAGRRGCPAEYQGHPVGEPDRRPPARTPEHPHRCGQITQSPWPQPDQTTPARSARRSSRQAVPDRRAQRPSAGPPY